MKVIEFHNEEYIKDALKNCEWGAGKFLYSLIEDSKIEVLGWNTIFVLVENENVISFCTLSQKDCIVDEALYPWIGFVYTFENYRGHRYSELVIQKALDKAKKLGYHKVYLATDHIGFYEKYGFYYMENRVDIYDEISRLYAISI